ncbi:MAG: hypothetical protein M1824_000025 [Vezdaea acicularis]|nr:MAG: hypothetical protein M1824_000025 [Vezdaea acicularis]
MRYSFASTVLLVLSVRLVSAAPAAAPGEACWDGGARCAEWNDDGTSGEVDTGTTNTKWNGGHGSVSGSWGSSSWKEKRAAGEVVTPWSDTKWDGRHGSDSNAWGTTEWKEKRTEGEVVTLYSDTK